MLSLLVTFPVFVPTCHNSVITHALSWRCYHLLQNSF